MPRPEGMLKLSLQRPADLPLVQTHSRGSQNLLQLTPVHSTHAVGVGCCTLLCSRGTAAQYEGPPKTSEMMPLPGNTTSYMLPLYAGEPHSKAKIERHAAWLFALNLLPALILVLWGLHHPKSFAERKAYAGDGLLVSCSGTAAKPKQAAAVH